MATTLEIIRGISQAAANIGYDGAHEGIHGDGEPRSAGLQREEGHMINDRRVIDGFGVQCVFDHPDAVLFIKALDQDGNPTSSSPIRCQLGSVMLSPHARFVVDRYWYDVLWGGWSCDLES